MNAQKKKIKKAVGRLKTKPPKVILDKKTYTRKKKHKTSEGENDRIL
jgi:hypothetical protein